MLREKFVDAQRSEVLTINIFIGISIMFLSLIIGGIFAWSYYNGVFTFISTLLFIIIIYALINLIYVLLNKKNLNDTTYNIQLGSAIYIICISVIMLIFFATKIFKNPSPNPNYFNNNNNYNNY
jgi:vacuolar-type H+-ATPase subunit I/STV1